MAFTNAEGQATIAGATLYTVPANTVAVIIGFRIVNLDAGSPHTITANIGPRQISPTDMELAASGGYELTDNGKFVAKAGETVVVASDVETTIDVFISILEQPA